MLAVRTLEAVWVVPDKEGPEARVAVTPFKCRGSCLCALQESNLKRAQKKAARKITAAHIETYFLDRAHLRLDSHSFRTKQQNTSGPENGVSEEWMDQNV